MQDTTHSSAGIRQCDRGVFTGRLPECGISGRSARPNFGLPDALVSYVGRRLRKVNDQDKPLSTAAAPILTVSENVVSSLCAAVVQVQPFESVNGQQCGVASPDHIRHICS